jgi:hypothetical protein
VLTTTITVSGSVPLAGKIFTGGRSRTQPFQAHFEILQLENSEHSNARHNARTWVTTTCRSVASKRWAVLFTIIPKETR